MQIRKVFSIWLRLAALVLISDPATAQEALWPEPVGAVIVVDENAFSIKGKHKGKYKKHRIVKIYNEAGKKYGRIVVHENRYITCTYISGKITDADGNLIRKLDKNDIHKNPYFPEYVLYQDAKYQAFELASGTFPYTVEYTYEKEYESLFFWPSWLPQEDVPVLKSTYTLEGYDKIRYQTHAIGLNVSSIQTGGSALTWQLLRIAPRVKERFIPPENETQMALLFAPNEFRIENTSGSFFSWNAVAQWYGALAAGQYTLPAEAMQKVRELVSNADTDRQKVEILYAFLQDHTRYVAIELGIGAWQPYSAESVFKNQYGDCKDLSTFMVAMLNACGITAYPALIGTRNHGMLIQEFPANQFNHCITFVPLQSDTLWLECTADLLAAGDLPDMGEGCDVLVIKENAGEIVRTPQSTEDQNRQISTITGDLTAFGTLTFSGEISGTGNAAARLRGNLYYLKPEDRKHWLVGQLGTYLPKLNLKTYGIEHLDQNFDQPVVVRVSGIFDNFGTRSANRLFVNPNILNRVTPEDVPREAKRQYPVYHPFAFTHVDCLFISIPEGYALEAAPDLKEHTAPFGSFKTTHVVSDNRLIYKRVFKLKHKQISLSQYEAYVEFMQDIVKTDQAPFVFLATEKQRK